MFGNLGLGSQALGRRRRHGLAKRGRSSPDEAEKVWDYERHRRLIPDYNRSPTQIIFFTRFFSSNPTLLKNFYLALSSIEAHDAAVVTFFFSTLTVTCFKRFTSKDVFKLVPNI